jgi:hypothetical protein
MAGQLTVDTLRASTGVLATQNGMTGIAKAWVNFDGETGSKTTIRSSFNVSSITYVTTGTYTISFTTAMPDANYPMAGSVGRTSDPAASTLYLDTANVSTNSARVISTFSTANSNGLTDRPGINAVFFSS